MTSERKSLKFIVKSAQTLLIVAIIWSIILLCACQVETSVRQKNDREEDQGKVSADIGKVTKVTAQGGDRSVTIRWDTLDGADGYCIYKSTDGINYKPYKYSSKAGKSFSNLENGVTYYFCVAAYKIIDGKEVYGAKSSSVSVVPINDTLAMSDSYLVLESNETKELSCRLYDKTQNAEWFSSDDSVASVSQSGLVKALGKGKAIIGAKVAVENGNGNETNEQTVYCTVEVDRGYPEPKVSTFSRYVKGKDGVWRYGDDSEKALLMFTGDLMALEAQMLSANSGDGFNYDFSHSFDYVKEIFAESDLLIGNLETTLCSRFPYSDNLRQYMQISNCNTTPAYLDALKYAGFDLLTTANNHYCDSGVKGIIDTIECLDDYNFMHIGTYKNASEQRYVIAEVNNIKLAILTYNQKTTNGKDSMLTKQEQSDMLGAFYRSNVKSDIKKVKALGAEFVIVIYHFGTQNTVAVTETQESIAQFTADCGADLIVCSHPHLLQKVDCLTSVDGRSVFCAYSLGNFLSSMAELDANMHNVILKVTIERRDGKVVVGEANYTPCTILQNYSGNSYVVLPCDTDCQKLTQKNKNQILRAYDHIVKTIGDLISPDIEPSV